MPRPTWVLLSIVNYFRWAHIAIISSSDDIWVETATKVRDGRTKKLQKEENLFKMLLLLSLLLSCPGS